MVSARRRKDWLESVTREVKAVRGGVGFCDVSTLGKIDVQGPDAGAFLDRVYINTFSNLAVGKARYGLMLREDGIVYDDGTTSRLAEDHYFLTTTTAKAGLVMQHLEFCRQVLFPELDVQLTSVSDQWAQFSIAGPKTRELLKEIVEPGEDLSNEGFPFMGAREVALRGGIKARLFRISFSGEMAFEISVPARYGDALVRNLMLAGKQFGVTPYGTEALGVMRVEKGHVAGPELNGTTTARDLGLGKMMSTKKDFIGRVMAGREALVAPDRQVVVGIKPVDKTRRLRSGAHIIPKGQTPGPTTTRAMSPRSASRRRSTSGSGWGWSNAAANASARSSMRMIRCAAKTTMSSCAIPSSTIRMEGASVAEFSWAPRSPLEHALVAGAYGAGDGPGVSLTEIRNFDLIQVMARRGNAAELAKAAKARFGVGGPGCT